MAFDYQALKKLTNNSFVSGSITGTDVGNEEITNTEISSNTIEAAKFADNSVNLTATSVSGTLPVSKGGTNTTASGNPFEILMSNSANTSLSFRPYGIRGMVVFTGNGTWTRPSNVRYIWVQVQAGGGGASGHGESGAAGGYSERILEVENANISSVGVTIGGGGSGTYYSNAGGNGAGSSFGPYLSAGGGHGANRHNQHNGGLSGVGSGGNLNLHAGCGGCHEQRSSGMGGSSFWGGPAPAGHPQGGHFAHNHQGHSAPGTGGTSGYFSGHRGSDGRPGIIVITEFY